MFLCALYLPYNLKTMNRILISSKEARELTGVTALALLNYQDKGFIAPVVEKGKTSYDLRELQELVKKAKIEIELGRPFEYPSTDFFSAVEAMCYLGIQRKAFYKRVKDNRIKIHKNGKNSFFSKIDILPLSKESLL